MRRLCLISLSGLLLSLGAGCGDDTPRTITDVRTRKALRRPVPEGLSAAERYGFRSRTGRSESAFQWKTPEGWEEKPTTPGSIRKGSWSVSGEPRTDCSLVALPGTGGGLADNINRWRGEMGLAPIDAQAIAALPRRKLLERESAYLNVAGTFSGGRSGAPPLENARMLGIVLALPQATLFLKFTGPAAVVEAQQGAFEALADSISFGMPSDAVHGGGPMPPPAAGGTGAAPGPGPSRAISTFAWDTPEGWEEQPKRMMRIVTFVPKDAPEAWCYASRLGGSAGGLSMNINRWRGEMGERTTLDDAAVAALPKIDMLGTKATLLELDGNFTGTGGPPQTGARMLGVVCPLTSSVVFVKMVGSPEVIAKHRDAFLAFCASLREVQ